MENHQLSNKISVLPPEYISKVSDFIDLLLSKHEGHPKKRQAKFGSAKGCFVMKHDFDKPLEDFKSYME